ncbi:MAG TPA: polysaccharide deacetylase family protein [Paenirhodobacter sp.]
MNNARQQAAEALAQRAAAGNPLRLWLRDDDAVAPSAPLDRLLDLTGAAGVPLTLAVIPAPWNAAPTGPDLARRLDAAPWVSVAVHGWSHHNHAPAGVKKQELGPHRPVAVMRAELQAGWARIAGLHGARALPMLVPPWNRIAPDLVPLLAVDGFRAISTFGPEVQVAGMQVLNTHLDIIDWHGGRVGRPAEAMWADLAALARSGRRQAGILTHHLVHDAQSWDFLADLFVFAPQYGAQWQAAAAL